MRPIWSDAAGDRSTRRRDLRGRDRRSRGRGKAAKDPPMAELPGGMHPAGNRTLHSHGPDVGVSGKRKRWAYSGDGGHQLPLHALSPWAPGGFLPGVGRLPVPCPQVSAWRSPCSPVGTRHLQISPVLPAHEIQKVYDSDENGGDAITVYSCEAYHSFLLLWR